MTKFLYFLYFLHIKLFKIFILTIILMNKPFYGLTYNGKVLSSFKIYFKTPFLCICIPEKVKKKDIDEIFHLTFTL